MPPVRISITTSSYWLSSSSASASSSTSSFFCTFRLTAIHLSGAYSSSINTCLCSFPKTVWIEVSTPPIGFPFSKFTIYSLSTTIILPLRSNDAQFALSLRSSKSFSSKTNNEVYFVSLFLMIILFFSPLLHLSEWNCDGDYFYFSGMYVSYW